MKKTRWETRLYELNWATFIFDEHRILSIDEMFRKDFPGKYTLVEVYDPRLMYFKIIPVFEDAAEETFWMLKYS